MPGVSTRSATSIWRNGDFVSVAVGRLVSTLGSGVSAIALPLLVLATSHSPARAGLVAALNGVPYFLLAIPAGVAVDRWPRKRILVAADLGRAAAWAVVGVAVATHHPSLALIGAAAVVDGALFILHNTAISAVLPMLVSDEQLPAAMAQESFALSTSDLLGPALGGILFQVSRALPFLVDAASYLASIATVLRLRRPLQAAKLEAGPVGFRAEAKEGLGFLRNQRALLTLTATGGLGDLVFAGIALVLIVDAQRRAHATPAAIGLIFALGAAGGALGAVLGGPTVSRLGSRATLVSFGLLGAVVFPVILMATGVASIAGLWFANIVLLGVANVARSTIQVRLVPDQLRGRVNSLVDLVSYGGLPIGTALAGFSLSVMGPVPTLGVMAAARAVLTAWLIAAPSVRHLEESPASISGTADPAGRRPLPAAVVDELSKGGEGTATVVAEVPIDLGTGAASGPISHLVVALGGPVGVEAHIELIRKSLRPLPEGRHARGATDPRHWAYWRREAEAYQSGLLPSGPGLRAPRCLGVVDDDLYLEAIAGTSVDVKVAASHLASWQIGFDPRLDRPWMATDQLDSRLAVSHLDWSTVDADPRAVRLWEARQEWMDRLHRLPVVRSHGDYSLGNLLAVGDDTVALDWATFGWEPLGFDLAHLALSSGVDPTEAYLAARPDVSVLAVSIGFTSCLAIIGSSRMHWMLSRGLPVPEWYVDFLWDHRPGEVAPS